MAVADFETLLKESTGLDATSIGAPALRRAVLGRASACGRADLHEYWQLVSASPAELQTLIEAVVVPETWFFRDRQAFSALIRLVQEGALPTRTDRKLRVLSLPSSTGEEPYSISMALFDAGVAADRFSIDAVGISADAISRARTATYGKNSFRGNELGFRSRYFDATTTGYRLTERVRRQVHFQRENLFAPDSSREGRIYDAIFCRNLLIYFDRATQDRAVAVLDRQLAPGGFLFVAPSEAGVLLHHRFDPVKAPLAFRKGAKDLEQKPHIGRSSRSHASLKSPLALARSAAAAREVASIAQPVIQTNPHPPSHAGVTFTEAVELANRGHFKEAIERCEQHLRRSGPSAEAFHLMGLVRDACGDPAEAATCYRKALYMDPNHREVLIHLALLLEKLGKRSEAELFRKRANRLQHGSGPQDAPRR